VKKQASHGEARLGKIDNGATLVKREVAVAFFVATIKSARPGAA
jgi:hypothetical protein